MQALGLDIGGTGIKAAPVNLETGELLAERHRVKTPQPATPEAVIDAAAEVVSHFKWEGPVGCGFPTVVKGGIVMTAANIDKSWIGVNLSEAMGERLGLPVTALNDADAAGLGEMMFGAGAGRGGLLILATLGTGIGTAVINNGHLIPNSELGHLWLPNGKESERYAAESAREREDLSWEQWGKRINAYLSELEGLLWPDLFILGGGGSKKFEKFSDCLSVRTPVVPATLRNQAGIVGAALATQGR